MRQAAFIVGTTLLAFALMLRAYWTVPWFAIVGGVPVAIVCSCLAMAVSLPAARVDPRRRQLAARLGFALFTGVTGVLTLISGTLWS
jgi:hypothetical protein